MFDGVPEQLHQLIASSRTPLVPLPTLSFTSLNHHHHLPHDGSSNPNNTIFPTFDPFITSTNSSPPVPLQVQASFLHPFNQQSSQAQKSASSEEKQAAAGSNISLVGVNNSLEISIERSSSESCNPAASWSNDEVLSLLRIRSSLDNWFPESTWEQVSRKLEELGYKRTAEKCKEKFEEEESRYLSSINYTKSHRFFNEFEEVYNNNNNNHGQNPDDESSKKLEKPIGGVGEEDNNLLDGLKDAKEDQSLGDHPSDDQAMSERLVEKEKQKKKRKRVVQQQQQLEDKEFQMLKGFCEDIVKKMMVQQEEMHHKLLEDMARRDEEKFAREETRKRQEMDRVNKELETRAHEQAIAGDRQATLIKFLKTFTSSISSSSTGYSSSSDQNQCFNNEERSSEESPANKVKINSPNSSFLTLAQNPNNPAGINNKVQNPSSNLDPPKAPPTSQNPNSPNVTHKKPLSPTSVTTQNAHQNPSKSSTASNHRDDIGKRWPRDEVFALINLRCSLHNNNGDHHQDHKERSGQAKVPLWERISQGMSELGYKRSAKRCKEKWENINKYFRKTKDVNKKRALDSRTCPYFHQLSTLYNQGTLVAAPPAYKEEATALPENHRPTPSENHPAGSSQAGSNSDSSMQAGHDHDDHQQDEKISVQVPTFDFEF